MSNARNLANTIGNGVINSDGYIDVIDRIILDGSDGSSTDAGDNLLLDATAASTNEGVDFLYETGSDDASFVLSHHKIEMTKVLEISNRVDDPEITPFDARSCHR